MRLGIPVIKKLLKHREPFLLIDEIEDISDDTITASLKVSEDNIFLRGHFPNNPVVPGVLLIEAMAQAAGCLIIYNLCREGKGFKDVEYEFVLCKVNSITFKAKITPPATLRIKVRTIPSQIEYFYETIGQIYVFDELKAAGKQVVHIKTKEQL